MSKKQPALSLEEALRVFHLDGALDVIAGATLLNFGFDLLGGAQSTSLFTWIPILLFSSLKNKNTLPKLHPFFEKVTASHIRRWILVPSFAMVVVVILLGVIMLSDALHLGELKTPAGFLLIALACLIPAFRIGANHFFIYSATAVAAGIAAFFIPSAWPMFTLAAAMVVMGSRMMIRFSKAYPTPEAAQGK